jgi:hypothetical protein
MDSFPLRQSKCTSCLRSIRRTVLPQRPLYLRNTPRIRTRTSKAHIARPGEQANPLVGFYTELLSKPRSEVASATRTAPSPPPKDALPKTDREEVIMKAKVVFGSRLAGPADRRSEIDRKSTQIAGILVPPRPEEPDNCCMSGCVNCVWDIYRDDLEEWAAKSAQAREAVLAMKSKREVDGTGSMKAQPGTPSHVATSMDDDGGGSEANWDTSGLAADGTNSKELFKDIPVGIREFMRTEKILKEKHQHERAQA